MGFRPRRRMLDRVLKVQRAERVEGKILQSTERSIPKMKSVAIVSCVKSKADTPRAARDLYISPLFSRTRQYALATADEWWILSARHGLIHPDQVIAPYEQTLGKMSSADRARWAVTVETQLRSTFHEAPARVIVLAGERYRVPLEAWAREHGIALEVPMRGLSFGRQLQWLAKSSACHGRVTPVASGQSTASGIRDVSASQR